LAFLAGFAILTAAQPAAAATDVLPDLTVARIEEPQIEIAGSQKRLRFTSILLNVGDGPFELRGQRSAGQAEMTVSQRIKNSDGGQREIGTPAVMYFAGDGHTHWHVRDLATYEIWEIGGAKIRTGAKRGFCFFDNYSYRLWEPGTAQSAVYRHCGDQSLLQLTVGLSKNWGDVYEYALPDQWIDISGLAAGRYRLVSTIDQYNWFVESDESNNSNWAEIEITASGQVQLLDFGPGPKLFLDTPAEEASVSDNTPQFSGRAEAGATVSVYVDHVFAGSTTATAGGTWSVETGSALGAGTHEAYAIAALGGLESQTSKREFSVNAQSGLPFADGFELGNLSQWTFAERVTVITGDPASGVYSARAVSTGGSSIAYLQKNFSSGQQEVFFSFDFKVVSKATTTVSIGKVRSSGGGGILAAYVSGGNYLGIRNEYAGISTTSNVPVSLGQWHRLEMRVRVNGSSGEHEIWLDGQRVASLSGTQNLGTANVGRVILGETITNRAHTTLFDDVNVDVSGENRPPTALNDAYSLPQDEQLIVDAPGLLANDSDPEGDAISAEVVTDPQHGVLTLYTDGSFDYVPVAGFSGQDSFTYAAADALGPSAPATVTLTVDPPAGQAEVLFTETFDSGNLNAWTKNFGVSVEAGSGYGGSSAARVASNNAGTYAFKRFTQSEAEVELTFRCKIVTNGPNTSSIVKLRQAPGDGILAIYVTKAGKLGIRNEFEGVSTTSTASVSYGSWHDFKVRLFVNGSASELEVWMDGQKIGGLSGTFDFGDVPFGRLIIGETVANRAYNFLLDDIVLTRPANAPP
jgi:hypothetical protein